MNYEDFQLGRAREREAIIAWLRHTATTLGLSAKLARIVDADVLNATADKIQQGWHTITSPPPPARPSPTSSDPKESP